jgi:hypothetical protein
MSQDRSCFDEVRMPRAQFRFAGRIGGAKEATANATGISSLYLFVDAGVAELVDAPDLGSEIGPTNISV